MFAQLLMTLTLIWIVAEVLCRVLLQSSVVTLARELMLPAPAMTEPSVSSPSTVPSPSAETERAAQVATQLGVDPSVPRGSQK